MNAISDLNPTTKARVIDLVAAAGLDVSDWANYAGGRRDPSQNPKYCYEWAFSDKINTVVLNLWHRDFVESHGNVTVRLNLLEAARRYGSSPKETSWKRRAQRLHEAARYAYEHQLPVRVIVCEGSVRDIDDPESESSSVKFRLLDSLPWAVAEYDYQSGNALLVRGAKPIRVVDQFAVSTDEENEKYTSAVEKFRRSAEVRRRVLARSKGKCEYCHQPGFEMHDGSFFLETHHVIPLSQDGPDIAKNMVAVCANHHREAHHGVNAKKMRGELLAYLDRIA